MLDKVQHVASRARRAGPPSRALLERPGAECHAAGGLAGQAGATAATATTTTTNRNNNNSLQFLATMLGQHGGWFCGRTRFSTTLAQLAQELTTHARGTILFPSFYSPKLYAGVTHSPAPSRNQPDDAGANANADAT